MKILKNERGSMTLEYLVILVVGLVVLLFFTVFVSEGKKFINLSQGSITNMGDESGGELGTFQ